MKNAVSIVLAFSLLLCSYSGSQSAVKNSKASVAEPDEFPVPKNIPGLLFYIQRDPNANTIIYHLNLDEQGQLSRKNPVDAFWIRYTDGGERRDLNYLQRKFAYGINSKPLGNATYELRSVAYSKMPLYLRKDSKNEYHVYANINKKECILSRVFIRIDGGTFWSPNVLYIELKGTETATGKTVTQRIKPV
ncbi:DUF4833 domain-containing protein [Dyadobacter sp. LJ53]|uniref:DUF4833 domain-containing protein n=1 Tax=Dyadobacter chenwenxiniae TaxID=2906456 RepID=UPI001F2D84D4|nr:DUF4833 domain-containing protein [Dyadobacter chenwenxiniae]MCF0052272.1 DUF4833 domain-containing protein [Dyadobacter chenwenxiniae]